MIFFLIDLIGDDDDLMDIEEKEGSKKANLPSASKSKNSKEKIDVTVNVNINGVPKTDKKKSKVETTKSAKVSSAPAKLVDVPAEKRSHVTEAEKQSPKASPTVTSSRKSGGMKMIADDDDDDDNDEDDDGDEDDEKNIADNPSDRRQHGDAVAGTNTRVSSTLSHLKDIKAPPALMNQLKKKIQQEEDDEDKDDEDEIDDDEDDISGSGSGMTDMTKKSQQDPINVNNNNAKSSGEPEVPTGDVDVKSKTNTETQVKAGEDTEKLGNNVHPNLHNNTLSAGILTHMLLFY